MNNDDHTDDGGEQYDEEGYSSNRAEDMTTAEIRERALDMLAECDGAVLVTSNREEGNDEYLVGSAVKFVRDDLPDEERHELHASLMKGAMRVAAPEDGPEVVEIDAGNAEGVGALLAALAGTMPQAEATEDDDEFDGYGFA